MDRIVSAQEGLVHRSTHDSMLRESQVNVSRLALSSGEQLPGLKLDNTQKNDVQHLHERVLDIKDVGSTIGWWQKQQYEKLGVEKIHLTEDGVSMQLRAHIEKYALIGTLGLDKKFSFQFGPNEDPWVLSNIKGMTLDGAAVSKVEAHAGQITFWTGAKRHDFGSSAADYMKALFAPLMRKELRN